MAWQRPPFGMRLRFSRPVLFLTVLIVFALACQRSASPPLPTHTPIPPGMENNLPNLLATEVPAGTPPVGVLPTPTSADVTPVAPEAQPTQPVTNTVTVSGQAWQIFIPYAARAGSLGPQLSFLRSGDVWMVEALGLQPRQMTFIGNALSFAWSSGGDRLALLTQGTVCLTRPYNGQPERCIDLTLPDDQKAVPLRLIWSPNGEWIVAWNPASGTNPGAVGWVIVPLAENSAPVIIYDPVDWGAELDPAGQPGGFTGQPLFLPDGSLIGPLSHRSVLCGSGGCSYGLFRYDLNNNRFSPFLESGLSEFGGRLSLSPCGCSLYTYGITSLGALDVSSFIYNIELTTGQKIPYTLPDEAIRSLSVANGCQQVSLAQAGAVGADAATRWEAACGLAEGFQVEPLQVMDVVTQQRSDLLPGMEPAWSGDGKLIAFQSCLVQNAEGAWEAAGTTPVGIYIVDPTAGPASTQFISVGSLPQWRP